MKKSAPISMSWLAGAGLVSMDSAQAQSLSAAQIEALMNQATLAGEGWAGFLNITFLLSTLLTLILAAVLGAVIAYHPKHTAAADTLEELEAPKVYILYAVIGAIIGILVVEYGLVVGLVIFGIGGLIRFRTLLRSANLTGRVIFVTLIGLACGLNMPHVGVIATLFAFVLIFLLEARVTYRVDINGLQKDNVAAAAAAYRTALERLGCRVLAEKKNPQKQRVILLIAGPKNMKRDDIAEQVESEIDASLKGTVDWETD